MTRLVSFRSRPQGFTLIEVMIAVLVLATGFLALTALQGALIRSSADSKIRSQVATYAASEMDRLRLGGVPAIAVGTYTIDASATATALGLGALTETATVTQYVADAAGNFTVNAGAPGANAYFKRVTLNMGWTDATGGSRSLVFVTDVSPLALTASKVLVDRAPPEDQGLRPVVRRQIPLTEGMIPIAMGADQDTAATNPKPELVGRNNDTLVSDTRFDLLTYNGADNLGRAGYVRFDKKIETAMVGCTCKMDLTGFPTEGSNPPINAFLRLFAFRPSFWDGTTYLVPKVAPYAPTRSPDTGVVQSQLCDVCCRDHEDEQSGTTGPRFNPWSAAGTHAHYLDPAGAAVTAGAGSFKEACRVIRVDGVWRVTPDPKVQDIALLPTNVHPVTATAPADNNSATSPLVSTEGKLSYVAFAYDFIKQFFYDKTTLTEADLMAMQGAAGLNEPEYVPIKSGDRRWLHARAILTDFLESDAAARLTKAKTECTATGTVERAQCVLPYAPLATINTTELASWRGRETSETNIVHTDPALIEAIKNYGQAMLNRFVSALALVGPINPADDDAPIKDEQTFALVPPATRTGTWLSVASPSGVLFGDASDPSRGFATISGGTRFYIELNGLPYASDRDPGNDPNVNIGISVPQPCNSTSLSTGGNPFECTTDSTSNVVVAVGKFNYLKTTGGNIQDPCNTDKNDKIGEGQAVCQAYTLAGGTLVSGTSGKPSEVSSVTLPSVTAANTYTLSFSEISNPPNAIAVCNASNQWTGWKCE